MRTELPSGLGPIAAAKPFAPAPKDFGKTSTRSVESLSQPALAHEGRRNQLPRLGGAKGEHRAALSHCCHQHPIFVTDPGLLVPQLSLLIPFLSLRRAALYKEEEKGKRNCLGLVACEKKNKFLAAQPGASSPRNTGKKAGLRT